MATPKLFRLKAEVAPAPSGPRASVLPFARVRVDTGVFHLDQLYDYQIPEKLSEVTQIGVRVQLPFGSRETEGIIVERVATPERAGELKSITKVLSIVPVANAQSLRLIDHVAKHFACNPWDVIRSAIPPRVASVDRNFSITQTHHSKSFKSTIDFQTLAPYIQAHDQVASIVIANRDAGSVLIVAPDEKDVDRIIEALYEKNFETLKLQTSADAKK